jgi:hypothetical protein
MLLIHKYVSSKKVNLVKNLKVRFDIFALKKLKIML